MRKIEEQMLHAIDEGRNWNSGNTMVITNHDESGCLVFLHGHHIATVDGLGNASPNLRTLADWPTVTTRSRLRALGINVYQRDSRIYVDDLPLDCLWLTER